MKEYINPASTGVSDIRPMRLMSILLLLVTMSLCVSCSDWLDVKPSDRISEENNFSSLAGFKQSLNGIYIEMNSTELYGKTLTCEFVEILAQRYAVSDENASFKEIMEFNYAGSTALGKLSGIWGKAYNLIANINTLLKNCELHRDVLPDEYYHLIKGEALALRAYLHFDLYRLFGPVYSDYAGIKAIPYYTEFVFDVQPQLTGEVFMKQVLADLLEAEVELADDPIVNYGVEGNSKDIFLLHRQLRLNYYAVQAVLARAYLYVGDEENASLYANKVIAVQEEKFPWVGSGNMTSAATMDRMFSSEIVFALQNLNLNTLHTSLFDGNNVKLNTLLASRQDVLEYDVFEGNLSDYRYVSLYNNALEVSGNTYCMLNKFMGSDSLYQQMMPMVRVSEMYLIAAETAVCASIRKATEKYNYLNVLRNHRGLRSLSGTLTLFMQDYAAEWRREFIGEGQLFYHYKRNKQTTMPSSQTPYATVKVDPSKYQMPLPDEETKYN